MHAFKGKIILIPGLGLTCDIYKGYSFPGFEIIRKDWLLPEKNEALKDYVDRFISDLDPGDSYWLIGHSFGGVLAQEISTKLPTNKIFLISSIRSESELPLKMRMLKYLKLYNVLNKAIITRSFPLWASHYGYILKEHRDIFIRSIRSQSDYYFKWATKNLVHWKSKENLSCDIVQIHGNKDKTFPINLKTSVIKLDSGDHFMVVKLKDEINQIINENLKT